MKRIGAGLLVVTLALAALPAAARAEGDITKDNWTERVGFKPEANPKGFKAGVVIDADGYAAVRDIVPDGVGLLVTKYKLRLWTRAYKPVHPSKGYIWATNKFLGTAKVKEGDARTRGIEGYVAGLPFPQPKTGLEVAWNYQYAYNGDDGTFHYGVYWIDAKKGVERWEEWVWEYIIRTLNRTDLKPRPAYKDLKEKEIQYVSMTYAIQPYDKRGFGAVYKRYLTPQDQEGWVYMPNMKRAVQMKIGSTGEAWNATDMLYEDVRGYMGYPEWMHWKILGKKTLLAPMHAGVPMGKEARDKVFDFKTPPHWNPKLDWEPRPVYVVEAKPKFPDYPYSRMVFYIDAETYYIVLKEAYDRKGKLWKIIINAYNESLNMDMYPPGVGTSLTIDVQAEHATAFPSYNFKANVGLKPSDFTKESILKKGK
ncbi:MAG: DUF1329 domain-containing protein [Deltaproteobacteria bacterium]|nr:DUF1329 domain-containing protein [Deltaproteobacteria bacterium]